jgi:hypothetical protein
MHPSSWCHQVCSDRQVLGRPFRNFVVDPGFGALRRGVNRQRSQGFLVSFEPTGALLRLTGGITITHATAFSIRFPGSILCSAAPAFTDTQKDHVEVPTHL